VIVSSIFAFGLLALTVAGAAPAVDDRNETDLGVPAWYGQTAWPTDHHDPRNTDFSPYVVPTRTKLAWEQLQRIFLIPGAATVFAGTEGVDGELFMTSARGRLFRHLHAFNAKTGKIVIQTPPWLGNENALDHGAIAGTPTHDASGNYYVVDVDQFWSWNKDGALRWVTNLLSVGIEEERIFLNPVITREGYVGGVTLDGLVAFFDPDDGTLAAPLLSLPGGSGPPCNDGWLLLWVGGEVSFDAKRLVYCVFFGLEVEIANTAALSPRTNRLFIGGAGPTPEVGAMYGIDLVDDGQGGKLWQIAWESPLGAGSGASPTLSPDGNSVFVTDGNNTLWSFDTETGAVNWADFGGESAASPSIDDRGFLFASAGANLLSRDGSDGSLRFSVNYDEVADQFLDPQPPIPFLIPNGNPVARIASVINLSPGKVSVPLALGYELTAAAALLGRPIPLPHANAIIHVDPDTGQIIPGSVTLVPDGVEGALTPVANGRMGVDQAVIFSSLGFYVLNFFLPPNYRVPGPPKAGYVALQPQSFREFAVEQIDVVLGYADTAQSELPGGDLQKVFDQLRRGRLQLLATVDTIDEAGAAREVSRANARRVKEDVGRAQAKIDQAAELLHAPAPPLADQLQARDLAAAATADLNAARGRLQ
jgi:hypothetical protein